MTDQKPPSALEDRTELDDGRRRSPSAARNRDPLLGVMREVLPARAKVLEIGSGTGEHAVHIAGYLDRLTWFPSDPDAQMRASIAAWITALGAHNIQPPVDLDVRAEAWPHDHEAPFDAVVSINMVHIAPWDAAQGLIAGAGRLLRPGGVLVLYGPFKRAGEHTAPSNAAFDESLRARDPRWGVRDIADLTAEADRRGFAFTRDIEMPANNLTLVFTKAEAGA